MVKVLDRKLGRDLRASGGLLIAIISIIAVGVMCFVYMRSSYNNLRFAQSDYYAEGRLADFWIELKKAPLTELNRVAEMPGVTSIRTRIQFFATVDLPRVLEPLNGLVLSLPDEREPIINDVVLMSGSYFTHRRDNEVIVNDAFAREHGLYPGQWIHILLNNRRQELFIVGTAISPEYVYLLGPGALTPDPEHFGVFYLKRTFAEEVFDFQGAANQLVGTLGPTSKHRVDELLDNAELMLEDYGVMATIPRRNQPSNRYLSDEIRGLGVFATIMPAIFLAVAATLLNVLMSRLIDHQQVIIGTLKALGYSNSQIFHHFVKFGMVTGLLGGVVGCIGGYFMAGVVTRIYRQFFEFPDLPNRFYLGVSLTGVAISLVCALAGSWHGAHQALRLEPAAAMRTRPPRQGGGIWLEHIGWLWRRLSFSWRMSLRNVIRNRFRTAVGCFAASMGATLLTAGFMMWEATQYLIDFQFEKVLLSDLDLSFESERGLDALLEVRQLPGVDYAEPQLNVPCTFVHGPYEYKGGITGLVENARLTIPRDLQGRPIPVPEAGLAMTRKLAETLRVQTGDEIVIEPTKGLREPQRVTVVKITDSFLGMAVYANLNYLSHLVNEELAISGVQLQIDPREDVQEELFLALKELPGVQGVNSTTNMIGNLEETLAETQNVFIGLLATFAGVIFFGSVLNASLVSLAEREREVATLRTLGYSPWQIGSMFLRETMIVTLLGTALGIPLGYSLTVLVSAVYDTEMFRLPVVSPPSVFFITIGLAVGFGLAAHLVVQRSIHQMDWVEAVKTRE